MIVVAQWKEEKEEGFFFFDAFTVCICSLRFTRSRVGGSSDSSSVQSQHFSSSVKGAYLNVVDLACTERSLGLGQMYSLYIRIHL